MIVDVRSVSLSLRDAKTGVVQYQPDYYGAGPTEAGEKAGGNAYPSAMPFGLMARPRDPSGSDAANLDGCEGLVFEGSDEGRLMPTTDPRYLAVIPDTGAGGAALYAVTDDGSHRDASTVLLAGEGLQGITAGSLFIRVPYAAGAKAHLIQVDLAANKIRLVHGDGPGLEITAAGVTIIGDPPVALAGPGGAAVMTDDGRMAAAFASLQTVLAGASPPISWTPPTGYTSTKATA